MATVLNTLYPPLIDTFMPAFPYDGDPTIEFSISPYNTANMINFLHVSLVNQKTNQNAFEGSNKGLKQAIPAGVLLNSVWILPFREIEDILHCDKDNLWHLTIPRMLLKNQNNTDNKVFTIDYYYKVQLRFDSSSNQSVINSADYLTRNRVYFSEWSSICLLKAIPRVDCFLKNFSDATAWSQAENSGDVNDSANEEQSIPQYLPGTINLTGFLTFTDGSSNTTTNHGEYLKSYYIRTSNSKGQILFQSETQYTALLAEKDSFTYLLDVSNNTTYPVNANYFIQIIFTTNNNYTFTKTYEFSLIDYAVEFLPIWNFKTLTIPDHGLETNEIVTEEDGIINFTIECGDLPPGYLYVRRKSSLDRFQTSELIYCKGFLGGNPKEGEEENSNDPQNVYCEITDNTVGSLIRYVYTVQYQTLKNAWTRLVESQEVYPNFHDILVRDKDRQLAIRYNAQVNSMTPVKTRVKIDTLGGKYPKFAENARLDYKQFTINGLITAESDFNRTFLNEMAKEYQADLIAYDNNMNGKYLIRNDTVLENESGSYGTYHDWIDKPDTPTKERVRNTKIGKNGSSMTLHDLYPYENWWWERVFREKVLKWLNNGEPKLWRSMTEGNMVVMFDGISLTPNTQLGRRTWNFSATVYEVEDGYSLKVLDTLGLYPIQNDYNQNLISGITQQIAVTNYQIGQQYGVQGTTNGYSIRDQIIKKIEMNYEGLGSKYQIIPESVSLNSVKIQFHDDRIKGSVPQWYNLDSLSNADEQIKLKIIERNSQGTSVVTDSISWEYLLKSSNSFYYVNEDGTESAMTAIDILTEYLSAWETEIVNGNILTKIEIEKENKWYYTSSPSVESSDYTSSEGSSKEDIVSAYASAVYSLIDEQRTNLKEIYNYGLGYKLVLELVSPYDSGAASLKRTVFVNEHGYYQIPSDINVLDVYLFDDQIATIDYLVQWDVTYKDLKDPSKYEVGTDIVGQVSGWWQPNSNINELIYHKYYYQHVNETASTYVGETQELEYWKASDFDLTPYTVLSIKQINSGLGLQKIVVGRTGTLRLGSDYPMSNCAILGRRMFKTTADRQPYLDEWEYILDPSVYEITPGNKDKVGGSFYWYQLETNEETDALVRVFLSSDLSQDIDWRYVVWKPDDFRVIYDDWSTMEETLFEEEEIKEPQYNTVYGVIDENRIMSYKLYYIDGGWYDVEFEDEDKTTMLAKVPVNGMINYKGSLIKKYYT